MKFWREYIKVRPYTDEPAPYYVQWVLWCWHKPIYIGLPAIILTPIFMVIDILITTAWIIWILSHWGGKE